MSRPMTERMLGALRLDEATYEEVEADQKATGEAAFIVVATSLVNGAVNGVFTGVSGGFIGALGSLLACVFGFVFGLPAITLLVGLWVLVATVVALRSALDITTGRAIWIAIASTFGQFLIIAIALAVAVALMPVSTD